MMHDKGLVGASSVRELRRRTVSLIAIAAVSAAGVIALTDSSAHAYTDKNGADFEVNSAPLSDVYKHGVTLYCDPARTQPDTSPNNGIEIIEHVNPCSMTVKITVSSWAAHYLKLKSTTLMSGSPKGPAWQTVTDGPDSIRSQDVYTVTLPPSLVRKLKAKVIDKFRLDGLFVTLSGTASYVAYINPAIGGATQTDTSNFAIPDISWGPGSINSCWMPVNHPPQVGLADPHGHLCPGY